MDRYPPISSAAAFLGLLFFSIVAAYIYFTRSTYLLDSAEECTDLVATPSPAEGEAKKKPLTAKQIKRQQLKQEQRLKKALVDEERKDRESKRQELHDFYQKKREENERLRQEDDARHTDEAYKAYKKLTESFIIEKEGSMLDHDQVSTKDFINFIIWKKMTNIVELSVKFGLPHKEVVDRIHQLEAQERLFGIFDERGRYLYITDSEVDALERYIHKSGRINKHRSLVSFCNTSLSVEPSEENANKLALMGMNSLQCITAEDQ